MLGNAYYNDASQQYGRKGCDPGACDYVHRVGAGDCDCAGTGVEDTCNLSTADKNHFMLNRSRKNLRRDVGRAIADFEMIADGDLVMVCLSGGKDSYTLLDILSSLQRHAPINYELYRQPRPEAAGISRARTPRVFENLGVTYKILEQDTYSIVTDKVPGGKLLRILFTLVPGYPL